MEQAGGLGDDRIDEILRRAEARLRGLVGVDVLLSASVSTSRQSTAVSFPKLDPGVVTKPYVSVDGGVARADPGRLIRDNERRMSSQVRRVEDPVGVRRKTQDSMKVMAGADWFNLPRTNLTPELKRDLQLLRMRSVLDPKRHYKKEDGKTKAPEFSQVATIIEGPTEFYSSRLQLKDRKRTLTEEVMLGERTTGRFQSKYDEIQSIKTSGKKAHYMALKAKRSKGIRR